MAPAPTTQIFKVPSYGVLQRGALAHVQAAVQREVGAGGER